ncbi:hypothetical protein NEUTE1DRAFT_97312 [Neurospora tetrasperma FGSC 2508]|uniref:Uncharacterized protein n=1 Tax=Neurospora tetrasperma (strain FGSC 2508 / ATCC MYA-4615 / P0657) TaxID=510951 RepID=F8MAH3_NEUT8|nr:uncharacterized protein NEUTE1DRAFT_97312 [Neurospora tetrasperma FGSC 2508]EGO60094.1 hypothetical protein NEUTE1DRAFT_97312 [Neurospora tetrasperma FGSC 2508]
MSRSITSFATKLVVDFTCEPNVRKQREAELTAALKEFAMMYQKHTSNSVNGAYWHVQMVKVLKDNMSAVNANITANGNNAVISANVDSTALVRANNAVNAVNTAMVNSTALVPANNAANAVNANSTALVPANNITMAPVPVPAPFNSTVLVPANTTNMNPVAINSMNNTNKRPANDQDSANKRSKTETDDVPGTTTTFNIDTNGPSTTRFHTVGYMAEFMLVGSGSVQVHSTGAPAFVQPAFVQQPASAALAARAPARAIAATNNTGAGGSTKGKGKGKGEGDDSPSQLWHWDVPNPMVALGGNEGLWYWQ